MKKSKYHIICSWLLLACFVTGQVALYAHQHGANTTVNKVAHQSPRQTVSEKCQLCDAMHFNSMALNQLVFVKPASLNDHIFIAGTYNFVSLSLILSSGRAPPLS